MTFFLGSGKNPSWLNFGVYNQPTTGSPCKKSATDFLQGHYFLAPKLSKKNPEILKLHLQPLFTCSFLVKKMVNCTDEIFAGENWLPNIPKHRSWTSWSTCGKQLGFFLAPWFFEALNTVALRKMYLLIKKEGGRNKMKYIQYIYNMYTLQWFFSFLLATSATLLTVQVN